MEINIKKYGNLDGITVLSGLNQSLLEKGIEEIYLDREKTTEKNFIVGLNFDFEMQLIARNEKIIEESKTDNEIIQKIDEILKENFNKDEIFCLDIEKFILIKALIEQEILTEGSTLFFLTPESETHPKFQVILSELIVMIRKKYKADIILATHSPFIISAIETYKLQYELDEQTNFYYVDKEKGKVIVANVSADVNKVYSLLCTPFFEMEDLECKLTKEN